MRGLTVPEHTKKRDWVARQTEAPSPEALQVAASIKDPWFRCQAYAHLALRELNASQRKRLIDSAFNSANEAPDPNRIVCVSAWPLKVLQVHGEANRLAKETQRLLAVIAPEPHPVRRADALFQVLGALALGPKPLFLAVLEPFEIACQAIYGYKGDWMLRHLYPVLDRINPERASLMLDLIKKPKQRALALKEAAGQLNRPLEQICVWPNIGRHSQN